MKFIQPRTLDELLSLIDQDQEKYVLLNGGTDIMPNLNRGELDVASIYDLSSLKDTLHFIKEVGDSLEIGALAKLSEIAQDTQVKEHIPQLAKAINSIGSKQIRHMGTLAGNIANASPVGDSLPVLLTKEAQINLISIAGPRTVSITDFFLGYKKINLQRNEIIYSITIPFNLPDSKYDFFKIAVRPEMSVSKINLAYAYENSSIRFASGGVKEIPIRLMNLETHFFEPNLSKEVISLILMQEIAPITDLRSTAEYRQKVLLNLIFSLYSDFTKNR